MRLVLRLEMYCRELTERFKDVWVISGPLTLPQVGEDKKKTVSYQVHEHGAHCERDGKLSIQGHGKVNELGKELFVLSLLMFC